MDLMVEDLFLSDHHVPVGSVIAVEDSCEQHLDGDYVRRGEFGDTGVAPGNPAKHVNLLRVGQSMGD